MSTDVGGGGYRRPPKHTQFKKGISGNPAGRPKSRSGKFGFKSIGLIG